MMKLKWQNSIKSASQIQKLILPKQNEIEELFPNHFNYYNPKYELSGDFYWVQKIGDLKLIAVADCTGHGVAASLLTICCYNGLNLAVKQFGLKSPAMILDKVNDIMNDFMQEHGRNYHDMGMDIVLCSIDEKNKTLTYSGASRPLYIISDRLQISLHSNVKRYLQSSSNPLFKIKGSCYSIGSSSDNFKLEEHTIKYQKGDQIYLSSDGFSDQYGKVSNKRFQSVNMIKLLLSIQNEDMKEQHQIITQTFNLWKDDVEQTDDVTILGVRL
ncbi:MAG: SpoIIE family protein phosphatase [Flavobacteriales bacterium]|nr:SpoIIE family protein phosphatase [Flavobacteriales bacterium]